MTIPKGGGLIQFIDTSTVVWRVTNNNCVITAKATAKFDPCSTHLMGMNLNASAAQISHGNTICSALAQLQAQINALSDGTGTVSNVSANDLNPLFTTSVASPTTTPVISFAAISQNANLFYASPNGAAGVPLFREIVNTDLAPNPDGTKFLRDDMTWQAVPIITSFIELSDVFSPIADSYSGTGGMVWIVNDTETGLIPINLFNADNLLEVDMIATGNITLSGIQNIDGQVGFDGARVLVPLQTDLTEAGVYIMSAGVWVRATDSDTSAELNNSTVIGNYTQTGTTYGGKYFNQISVTPTIGVDDIVYQVGGIGGNGGSNGLFWALIGNSNTPTNNKLGSTNNKAVYPTTNNVKRGVWDTSGNFGWGITASLLSRFHIKGAGTSTGSTFRITNSTPTDIFEILDNGAFALGLSTNPGTVNDVIIGKSAVTGNQCVTVGSEATTLGGVTSTAIGYQSSASGSGAVAIGSAGAAGVGSIAIGFWTSATHIDGIAIGEVALATAQGAIIIGGSNQGAVTNDVQGSMKIMLSAFPQNKIAGLGMFLYNTSNLVLFNYGVIQASQAYVNYPFDWTARNVLTIHNAQVPNTKTILSVTDSLGVAWFVDNGLAVNIAEVGAKCTLSGSAVYANGTYYAHYHNATSISLHPTRVDAILDINALAYISNEAGATITFFALNPDPTHPIADVAQIFSADNGAGNAAPFGMSEAGQWGSLVICETKTTTGDPTGYPGRLVINTVDSTIKIYGLGAWRDIYP